MGRAVSTMSLGDHLEIVVSAEFSREFLAAETNRSQSPAVAPASQPQSAEYGVKSSILNPPAPACFPTVKIRNEPRRGKLGEVKGQGQEPGRVPDAGLRNRPAASGCRRGRLPSRVGSKREGVPIMAMFPALMNDTMFSDLFDDPFFAGWRDAADEGRQLAAAQGVFVLPPGADFGIFA